MKMINIAWQILIGTAFYEGEGDVYVEINSDKLIHFNNRFELDGMTFEEPVPNLFNFNNPFGACPTCEGFFAGAGY